MSSKRRSAGLSLIEVVVFIVVVGLAFAGILILYNRATTASVDPLIRKQALAISASLLEEIELHAFTFCDPDDSKVFTATAPTATECSGAANIESIGVEGAETRYGATRFDNVSDYNGYCMGSGCGIDSTIVTAAGSTVDGLASYRTDVAVAQISAGELGADVPATEALRITVTTRHVPTGTTISLQGYRVRYAPNSP